MKELPVEQQRYLEMAVITLSDDVPVPDVFLQCYMSGQFYWINFSGAMVETAYAFEYMLEDFDKDMFKAFGEWLDRLMESSIRYEYYELSANVKEVQDKLESCLSPKPFHKRPLPSGQPSYYKGSADVIDNTDVAEKQSWFVVGGKCERNPKSKAVATRKQLIKKAAFLFCVVPDKFKYLRICYGECYAGANHRQQ